MKRGLRVLPLVVISLLASACGGTSRLDDLKTQMGDLYLAEQNVTLNDIQCPEDSVVEAGASFQCSAGVEGGEGRLQVNSVVDADLAIRFEQLTAIVVLSEIEVDVAADLSFGLGAEIVVSCTGDEGVEYKLLPVGGTFRCTAQSGNSTSSRDVEITVTSLNPPHEWRLLSV